MRLKTSALKEVNIARTTYNKWQFIMAPPVPVDDWGDGIGLPTGIAA
ncbi:MAG: hypothetical protein P4M00_11890 [Azospirillaceae bacterium]|nr:hypothetical protein [Azospirillaceae bacterium]